MTTRDTSSGAGPQEAAQVAARLAAQLTSALPRLKAGSLAVFGDVFGGRIDAVHRVVSARAESECLVLEFDGAEVLHVWDADGVTASERELTIRSASRVRWEWFAYGSEHTDANRYRIEHVRSGDTVTVSTDVTWARPSFAPSTRKPAVALLG